MAWPFTFARWQILNYLALRHRRQIWQWMNGFNKNFTFTNLSKVMYCEKNRVLPVYTSNYYQYKEEWQNSAQRPTQTPLQDEPRWSFRRQLTSSSTIKFSLSSNYGTRNSFNRPCHNRTGECTAPLCPKQLLTQLLSAGEFSTSSTIPRSKASLGSFSRAGHLPYTTVSLPAHYLRLQSICAKFFSCVNARPKRARRTRRTKREKFIDSIEIIRFDGQFRLLIGLKLYFTLAYRLTFSRVRTTLSIMTTSLHARLAWICSDKCENKNIYSALNSNRFWRCVKVSKLDSPRANNSLIGPSRRLNQIRSC
jgi:hypothetical protein